MKHLLKLAGVIYLVRVIRAAAQREHRELNHRLDLISRNKSNAIRGVRGELSARIDALEDRQTPQSRRRARETEAGHRGRIDEHPQA